MNPKNDLETINAELQLADLQTLEKAIPRIEKEVKTKKADASVLEAAVAAKDALERGILLSHSGLDLAPIRELGLLTAKPYIYVFNVDEAILTDAAAQGRRSRPWSRPAHAVFLDAKIESELIDLDPEDAAELLASTGQDESGLDQLARIGFDTLGLQTYLTAGPEGGARLDDRQGLEGPAGGRRDPHRLREGLHQGRGHLVRRPRSTPVRCSRPATAARPASRARTTSCTTATWSSSASTSDPRSRCQAANRFSPSERTLR